MSTNAAVFFINWDDLQLNVANPAVPAQFYISNVGAAKSRGLEFELGARVAPGLDLLTAYGYTHARFGDGASQTASTSTATRFPTCPTRRSVRGAVFEHRWQGDAPGRADAVFYGSFQYNDQNSLGQEAYSLVNLRLAATGRFLIGELLVRNAFDTRYIPLAFAYPSFAPSGFMGEMGAPRTVSFRAGVRF